VEESYQAVQLPEKDGRRRGIQKLSPLFRLYEAQNFDPFKDTPLEPLHNFVRARLKCTRKGFQLFIAGPGLDQAIHDQTHRVQHCPSQENYQAR
jgi:hypothetical protein